MTRARANGRIRDPGIAWLAVYDTGTAAAVAGSWWALAHAWQPAALNWPAMAVSIALAVTGIRDNARWLRSGTRQLRRELVTIAGHREDPEFWLDRGDGMLLSTDRIGPRRFPLALQVFRLPTQLSADVDEAGGGEVPGIAEVFTLGGAVPWAWRSFRPVLCRLGADGRHHARRAPRLHTALPDRVRLARLDRREHRSRTSVPVLTGLLNQLARAEPRPGQDTLTGDED